MEYNFTQKHKQYTFMLMGAGVVALLYALVAHIDGQRIWANLLANTIFFLYISIFGALFMAIQFAAEAGWSAGLKRVPEAMSQFIPVGGIFLLIILACCALNLNHLYHWMDNSLFDPASDNYDKIIAGKKAFLNKPFFFFRTFVYLGTYIAFTRVFRKRSMEEDLHYAGAPLLKKNMNMSGWFLVCFAVFSSTAAWDWVLSIDTHWFSTLFGWYNFATLFVSGFAAVTLFTIHLKRNGYFQHINENHLHDLGKFMFAFSIFWTYLWFAQFMLIWYANIPEEVTYFMDRWENYKFLFFFNLCVNFIIPLIVLMSRDAKRNLGTLAFVASAIFIGHWIDIFLMIMPGTVKERWGFGPLEILMFLGFLGIFIFVVLTALTKAALVAKNHPFLVESEHHHI